jgi:hypothetical protein
MMDGRDLKLEKILDMVVRKPDMVVDAIIMEPGMGRL